MADKTTGDLWQFVRADVRVLRLVFVPALVLYLALVIAPRVIDWALGKPLQSEVPDLAPFVIGLVMLVAGECFRQGLRLYNDVDGLV